ncbi:hypothetical protein [uncultured Corynebacterium sp.]|uniref:hypothetical protein n=1 Tax=uncultured Corynebacterium sp. TaxID=159447 RepID=UPI0025F6A1BA|nr:hypothetical protein [uncultured Corynebacterium sp.]
MTTLNQEFLTMDRLKIEQLKAVVMTIIALLTLAVAAMTHNYAMAWVPVLLSAFAAWFWWKWSELSQHGE